MKILITGATGFLGTHLVEKLCADGLTDDIRVLARTSTPRLEALGVEVIIGSVTDPADCKRACKGVEQIYHLAGLVSRKSDDAHKMFDVHVAGTRHLCQAAVAAGVVRIVLVSTSGTIAVSREKDAMGDETLDPPMDIIGRFPYYSSKRFQEETAIKECAGKVDLVTVNPSLLLGPGDDRLSSTRDVLLFLGREIPVCPPGGLNLVDVRDVAAVLPVAMAKGRPGEKYLLGGPNWTLKEFFGRLERLSKIKGPLIQGRGRWPYFASRVQSAVLKSIGRTPAIDPESVEQGEYFWYFSSDKARRELGFTVREESDTLFATIQYLREHFLGRAA